MKVVDLILAAGEAKRFGYPKQILRWGSSTILGTVIEESLKANFYKTYVVLGAHFDKITKTLQNTLKNVNIVHNKEWQNGMFSSIKAGIRAIDNKESPDFILIQLGDMPFITYDILNKFIELASENYNVVIGVENNRPAHPYMFHKKFIEEILAANYPDGMRSFIKKEFPNAYKLPVDKKAGRDDIDTWDVYKKFQSFTK
jgi:molybdenum cofactor cytidylyltransferase